MKQENYVIGLDLGINNVGWSILDLESHNIEKSGVRLFNPSSDAKDRRSNRSTRRRLKRSKNRVVDALKLFDSIGVNIKPSIDEKLLEKRVKGLKEQISLQDIVNITKYFMQHRGYIPFDDEEVNFIELNGKYPCEYYSELFKEKGKIRALNETVKISDNLKEYECLLSKQTEYYPDLKNIKEELISTFKRKREFWEGPGSENSLTPYGRFKTAEDVLNYRKNKEEKAKLEKFMFGAEAYSDNVAQAKLNPNVVGKPAEWIAEQAGFKVPAETQIICAECKEVGPNEPLTREKLSPVLADLFSTKTFSLGTPCSIAY